MRPTLCFAVVFLLAAPAFAQTPPEPPAPAVFGPATSPPRSILPPPAVTSARTRPTELPAPRPLPPKVLGAAVPPE